MASRTDMSAQNNATTTHRSIDKLVALPRGAKKTLAIFTDSALCVITTWLAICLRFESWVSLAGYQWLAVALSIAIAIPLLTIFGFYHTVIRYVGRQTITAALRAITIYAVIYSAIFSAFGFPLVPRTIGVLQPLLLLICLALVRLLASQLLSEPGIPELGTHHLPAVLIYGAGESGQQLAALLKSRGESRVVAFIDDNTSLHNAQIDGIAVYGTNRLQHLKDAHDVKDVLLAMPSVARSRRNEILKLLSPLHVGVRTLPNLTDLASGKINKSDLRELDIEDLLGRDTVAPIPDLLRLNITDKVVLVTGAGGSIGSELCRQIVKLNPRQLIMLDASEFALYAIHDEIKSQAETAMVSVIPVLANIVEADRLKDLFLRLKPNTVYHAAAYKHVPLVEANPVAGLRNNVLGTYSVAMAALTADAQDMVMISTDKAVRPTNVMGASKRLAEMVLQAIAHQNKHLETSTRFCLVRFGNVLGSSGSVVPKFREQIKQGGPITLTHEEVTRFFMTTSEAAQLVLQAGAMQSSHSQGAHVYLLDMGESIKIIDLARLMIQLNGMTVRNESQPAGDIEIHAVGLRPGEKMYEELLISENAQPTRHEKIRSAQEMFLPLQDILDTVNSITEPSLHAHLTSQEQLLRIRAALAPLVNLHSDTSHI